MMEQESAGEHCLSHIGPGQVVLRGRSFLFDSVWGPSEGSDAVWRAAVEPLVEHVFNGFNATVLAYGQTGSGKTHTMSGTQRGDEGVIPRFLEAVFHRVKADSTCSYDLTLSVLEIYNEQVTDLLADLPGAVVAADAHTGAPLAEVPVSDIGASLHAVAHGLAGRTTASTSMNA